MWPLRQARVSSRHDPAMRPRLDTRQSRLRYPPGEELLFRRYMLAHDIDPVMRCQCLCHAFRLRWRVADHFEELLVNQTSASSGATLRSPTRIMRFLDFVLWAPDHVVSASKKSSLCRNLSFTAGSGTSPPAGIKIVKGQWLGDGCPSASMTETWRAWLSPQRSSRSTPAKRDFREGRDAVIALLAGHRHKEESHRLGRARELRLFTLDFLKAEDVRVLRPDETLHQVEPQANELIFHVASRNRMIGLLVRLRHPGNGGGGPAHGN